MRSMAAFIPDTAMEDTEFMMSAWVSAGRGKT